MSSNVATLANRTRGPGADWRYRGEDRPPFARPPAPGQESVWDYPRPPALVSDRRLVEVYAEGRRLARTWRALRVLETASPPTFYLPDADVDTARLVPARGSTFCEWKGSANYYTLADLPERGEVAWRYPDPFAPYESLAGYLAFYPGRVDCYVDGTPVEPQSGGFYGGWVTPEVVGPFKGEPGTGGW